MSYTNLIHLFLKLQFQIYLLGHLLLYAVRLTCTAIDYVLSVKAEASNVLRVNDGSNATLNTTTGGEENYVDASSSDVFNHLIYWTMATALCVMLAAQIWAAIKVFLAIRQVRYIK